MGIGMHGPLDLRKNTSRHGFDVYQVRYEAHDCNYFARSMSNQDLRELLYLTLALPLTDAELEMDFDQLVREGHLRFDEIEMKASELAGAGLRYLEPEA